MSLTYKQLQVLKRLGAGQGNREIAADMGWRTSTVDHHWQKLRKALGFQYRWQAMHYALAKGLTPNIFGVVAFCFALNAPAQPLPPMPAAIAPVSNITVKVTWDNVPGATAYRVYAGTNSRNYIKSSYVVSSTNFTWLLPRESKWYFTSTALMVDEESELGNEMTWPFIKTNLWVQFVRLTAPAVTGPWTPDLTTTLNLTNPVGNRFAKEQITETPY